MAIQRNRHKAGRLSNVGFGLLSIADGLVRVVSLGFLHTDLLCRYSSWQAKQMLKRARTAP